MPEQTPPLPSSENNPVTPDKPLGSLEADGNKYKYASFIYPLDLGAHGAGKDQYVVFHINETTTTQFKTRGQGGITNTQSTLQKNQTADQTRGEGGGFNVPKNGGESSGKSGNETATDKAVSTAKQPIRRIATTIVLPYPQNLATQYQANWSETQLGAAADFVAAARGTGSKTELLKSVLASGLKEALGPAANSLTDLNLTDALSRAGRVLINPHQEVIFENIPFRQFTFQYRFMPESEDEATTMDNIIRAFKFYAAPEVLKGTAGRFWIYPAEFDIEFHSNGAENQFVNKITTCALVDIQINYTAAGHWAAHRPHQTIQGTPSVCTDLTLTFKELELITKRRVLEGF